MQRPDLGKIAEPQLLTEREPLAWCA